jgi:hypothetical protein
VQDSEQANPGVMKIAANVQFSRMNPRCTIDPAPTSCKMAGFPANPGLYPLCVLPTGLHLEWMLINISADFTNLSIILSTDFGKQFDPNVTQQTLPHSAELSILGHAVF